MVALLTVQTVYIFYKNNELIKIYCVGFFSWKGCCKNSSKAARHFVLSYYFIYFFDNRPNFVLTQRLFEKENAICPLWIVLLLSGAIRLKDKKLSSKWQYQQTKALWAIKADKRWYSCGEASGGAKVEYPLSKLKLKGKK